MTPTQRERAAQWIVEAANGSDRDTCKTHGISLRTLQRYRAALATDDKLAQLVAEKRKLSEADWADKIPGALRASVDFLKRAAEQADPTDPDAIHSVAGAMKLLSETKATWKMLDVRLARLTDQARPGTAANRPAAAGGATGGAGTNGSVVPLVRPAGVSR